MKAPRIRTETFIEATSSKKSEASTMRGNQTKYANKEAKTRGNILLEICTPDIGILRKSQV